MLKQESRELVDLLQPVIGKLGYELLGIEYYRQKNGLVVRLYIDNETGITLDDCVRVNDQVIGILDVHDVIAGRYSLEVSSPGLDRPLFTLEQFARFLGQKVKVKLRERINKRRKIIGVISVIENTNVVINEDGVDHSIPFNAIDSARLVLEI